MAVVARDGAVEPGPATNEPGNGIAVGEPHPGLPTDGPKDLYPCEPGQVLMSSASNGSYWCSDDKEPATSGSVGTSSGKVSDDTRDSDSSGVEVLAPIDEVELLIRESFPVQYAVRVVSGLPNSCFEFAGISSSRDGNTILIKVINTDLQPDGLAACAEIYGLVENVVELGTDFEPGETYNLMVNDVIQSFVAQ